MGFSISFLTDNDQFQSEGNLNVEFGQIVIGEFVEKFEAPVSYWSVIDYEKQWIEGISRIVQGNRKSCLITSMFDPKYANFLVWWLIYREDKKIYFQNQILFMSQIGSPFNPENPFPHISDRETVSEDGVPISEWDLPLSDLFGFLASKNG